jgi:hypothetical protein
MMLALFRRKWRTVRPYTVIQSQCDQVDGIGRVLNRFGWHEILSDSFDNRIAEIPGRCVDMGQSHVLSSGKESAHDTHFIGVTARHAEPLAATKCVWPYASGRYRDMSCTGPTKLQQMLQTRLLAPRRAPDAIR